MLSPVFTYKLELPNFLETFIRRYSNAFEWPFKGPPCRQLQWIILPRLKLRLQWFSRNYFLIFTLFIDFTKILSIFIQTPPTFQNLQDFHYCGILKPRILRGNSIPAFKLIFNNRIFLHFSVLLNLLLKNSFYPFLWPLSPNASQACQFGYSSIIEDITRYKPIAPPFSFFFLVNILLLFVFMEYYFYYALLTCVFFMLHTCFETWVFF